MGGSTIDAQVVERDPIVNICHPGDSIMFERVLICIESCES